LTEIPVIDLEEEVKEIERGRGHAEPPPHEESAAALLNIPLKSPALRRNVGGAPGGLRIGWAWLYKDYGAQFWPTDE
jgi:hypothetical protein